jgi:deoxyribodipyrimidine photo-lyase
MNVAVVVFTRDLRLRDNPALAAARAQADAVVPLFVLDDAILRGSYAAPNRLQFLLESLTDLDRSLRDRGARLIVRRGRWAETVIEVATAVNAIGVHVGGDVSAYAQQRTADLRRLAPTVNIDVQLHDGLTVVPPDALRSSRGGPFLVFTPYYRRWLAQPWRAMHALPRQIGGPNEIASEGIPALEQLTRERPAPELLAGGETEGIARLRAWSSSSLARYDDGHDDLAGDRTSHISAYLHFGCLSPLEVATRLRDREGGEAFVRQLCWRDFYAQLLAARPEVAHDDVRPARREWSDDAHAIDAWRAGTTGFPLVDAGMRQLRREGFMHNRARMVTASFLTKDLMVDWRVGAAHFLHHLVDGDIAQNQLNWQWVAGTGTDTNPHRVYNPTVQSRTFDPDGAYIRRYVDELRNLDSDVDIHDPPADVRRRAGYPPPIVRHQEAIQRWRASQSR